MAAPAYQISRKSTFWFKVTSGGHRQAGDLISPLSYFGSRLKNFDSYKCFDKQRHCLLKKDEGSCKMVVLCLLVFLFLFFSQLSRNESGLIKSPDCVCVCVCLPACVSPTNNFGGVVVSVFTQVICVSAFE
jgi:hypothetical protein